MNTSSARVGFVSLGCPKATVDSERILSQLRAEGYTVGAAYADADVVIVNTCGFIDAAVEESLDAIGEAIAENGRVIVTGCLGAKTLDGKDIVRDTHPSVLAVTGPQAVDEVMSHVHAVAPPRHDPHIDLLPPGGLKLTPRHYAYLKIAEGCNHQCTFCIIPSMRGKLRSRPVDDVMQEAENLVSAGVKELLIISQDTSAYGVDLRYETRFHRQRPIKTSMLGLAKALAQLDVWVRLHYVYPYPHVDDVLPLMAQGHILPYLDVPFQHASESVLRRMKRPAHGERNLERIQAWRSVCPELVIRSTFIVGFPGETEAEFEELLAFIEQAELDRVGCFTYSPVDGARANALADHVPEDVKQERLARLMDLQADVSAGKLYQREGQILRCLVDAVDDDTINARSYADAPEIDGIVVVQKHHADSDVDTDETTDGHADAFGQVAVGDFIDVEVVGATEHDIYAKLC